MPSSVIRNITYLPESSILRITYLSGNVYDYKDVPQTVYEEMKKAFSKGTFLNTHIKPKYTYERIK